MGSVGIAVLAVATGTLFTSPEAPREARFANPPGDSRVLPIRHRYPLNPADNISEIFRLAERGFGGFAGNVYLDAEAKAPRYVENEALWPAFVEGARYAHDAGMALWLYDELGYPSLSAGDIVLRGHPELEQTGWMIATAEVKGGEKVTLEVPPGKFVAAVAFETDAKGNIEVGTSMDISAAVRNERPLPEPFAKARKAPADAAGRPKLGLAKTRDEIRTGPLVWTAPAGAKRRVYVITEDYIYEGTHPECKGMQTKFRYPNPLVKAATERFCEVTHGAYAKHLGSDLGKCFTSTFTDEPSLMGNWWRTMPYFVLSSAPGLAERYGKRTGGDLIADIPYLVTDSADGNKTSGAKRIAFWDESARMYEDAFFKTISDWCGEHGLRSGGHLMGEESFAFHVSHYGDFFRCMKALDSPSIDCLTSMPSNVPYLAALFAGSARELKNAAGGARRTEYTMVEVSDHAQRNRKPPYQVNEDEVQGTLNRLLWGGINTFTSYYGWGSFSDEETRSINLRLGRASMMLLRDGYSAADVALFYPAKDAMRVYRPQACVWVDKNEPVRELQAAFDSAAKELYEDGRPFLIIDEETIENARIEGDALAFGKLRFRAVVLPKVETMSEKARARLDEFAKKGGILIRTNDGAKVAETLNGKLEQHVSFQRFGTKGTFPIRVSHRRTKDGDVFFVMNDSGERFSGSARFCGKPEDLMEWNLSDGSFRMVSRTLSGRVKVTIPPYRALIFTTKRECAPQRITGEAVKVARADVMKVTPQASSRNSETMIVHTKDGGWMANGKILESGKDSFHFLYWCLAKMPLECTDNGIRVTVEVPVDSAVAPNLGMFLDVPGSASFYNGSRQKLNKKGVYTVDFPFGAFRPHKCKATFSPEDIMGLRIGFGGFTAPADTRTSFIVRKIEIY